MTPSSLILSYRWERTESAHPNSWINFTIEDDAGQRKDLNKNILKENVY